MRFFCHCLNVKIDVLEINDDHETLTQFVPIDLLQIGNVQHEWFLCNAPFDQSVLISWQSLVQLIPVRDMKLYRCLGCNLYTHTTNSVSSRMLINKELFNETTVKHVYQDPNYSRLTRIVLPSMMNSLNTMRLSGSQDENINRDCELAQHLCRRSIEDIERETEEKIRMYQREQENMLALKTDQLNKELDRFLSLIRSVSKHATNTRGSPTLQSSSSYINENSTESGFGSDIIDINAIDIGRPSNIERTLSERNTNIYDEVNDDTMLDNRGWYSDSGNISNFATSLPKDIMLRSSSMYPVPQSDDDDIDDLERIGKSFRDLSRSMCTDGTEVFGELPSPRLNVRQT